MVKLKDYGVYWRNNYSILDKAELWSEWALPRSTGFELVRYLETERPKVIVEGGSGLSTVLLAGYAAKYDAQLVTLEHDSIYLERTKTLIGQLGLTKFVDLRLVQATKAGWYHTRLPNDIDFALIDGPPERIGRHGAMPALYPHLNPSRWQVWMDDANRPDEADSVKSWSENLQISYRVYPLPRGLAVMKNSYEPIPFVKGKDLAITILTGGRPDLMWRTFSSVNLWAPGLLDAAHVTVLHNGPDPKTVEELHQVPWINVIDVHPGARLPVGMACSRLFTEIPVNIPYHLHLEDDWTVGTIRFDWLRDAKDILDYNEDVTQVRLRHRGEPVKHYNMANGKEIHWEEDEFGVLMGNAHYTLNPALMRTGDVLKLWPAESEVAAMRRMRGLVAQSDPGVFHHIGQDRSLEGHRWQ